MNESFPAIEKRKWGNLEMYDTYTCTRVLHVITVNTVLCQDIFDMNLDIIRPWLGVNYVLFSSGWYRHHMRNKYLLKYNINLYLTFKQICGSFSTTKKYSSWITKKSIFKNLRFFCGPLLLYFWVTVQV